MFSIITSCSSETETRPEYYCNHAENQRESDYQSETIRAGRWIIVRWIINWRNVSHQIFPSWNSWHAARGMRKSAGGLFKDGWWSTKAAKRTQIPLLHGKIRCFHYDISKYIVFR